MKFLVSLCLLLVTTSGFVKSQGDPIDERVSISTSTAHTPPQSVRWIPNFNQQTPESALFIWDTVLGADQYVLRIYEGSVLELEIRNLDATILNVTGLRDNTTYTATVSSLYNLFSDTVESVESNPTRFTTDEICRNGKIYTPCLAGCIFTCGKPNIICDRVCRPGCNCDISKQVLHNGMCIPPQLCPVAVTAIRRPTNLQTFPIEGNRLILAWDIVPDAIAYVVTVALSSNAADILQRLRVDVPVTQIGDLIPGEEYVFRVTADFGTDISGRQLGLGPPTRISISNVRETGFDVSWQDVGGAKSYGIRLFEGDSETAIYSNDDLPRNTILFSNLSPGTVYTVAISAALIREGQGPLSGVQGVRTLGEFDPLGAGSGASVVTSVMPLTTSPTTTTTTTTTVQLTVCQQRYALVSDFLESSENENSDIRLPVCGQAGFFVTTVCDPIKTNECYCVDAETGDTIEGSNYGGENSMLPLDCNQFGAFGDAPSGFAVTRTTSTVVDVTWSAVEGAFGYIVIISAPGVSRSVTVFGRSTEFANLQPGTNYVIRVIAVNTRGWSSPMAELSVRTLYIDPPTSLRAFSRSSTSIRIVWRNNPQADFYNVEIAIANTTTIVDSITEFEGIIWVVQDLASETAFDVRVTASVVDSPGVVFTSVPTTITTFTQCELPPLDILFVADISMRTNRANLNQVKYFMANLSQILPPIDSNSLTGSRIALVRYFRIPSIVFDYDRFQRTPNAIGALRFLRYAGGVMNSRSMVDYVYNQFVDPERIRNPTRPRATQVTIIFAGGASTEPINPGTARNLALRSNVFTIGVNSTNGPDLRQLRALASSDEMSLVVNSYDELDSLYVPVQQQLCMLNRR